MIDKKVRSNSIVNSGGQMKLNSFSVENYRSITTARKVPLEQLTVLVGANNEGKSNILRALSLAMRTLARVRTSLRRTASGSVVRPTGTISPRVVDFNWERDFPVSKQQSRSGSKQCKITLEFDLEPEELDDFKDEIGSSLNGHLPIVFEFGKNAIDFSIAKPGRGNATLNKAKNRIAQFVSKRISFEYIPAIRTSQAAKRVVGDLVSDALMELYDDDAFNEALDKIEQLQTPILNELADQIQETVSEFLPSIQKVELKLEREDRYRALSRGTEVIIDDGNRTSLGGKGEGVQSLVALALMRQTLSNTTRQRHKIIAIEEPESHLHPKAVHELREVITDLASTNQIVLTTHSPLFASPSNLSGLVIVQNSKAIPATSLGDVRDCLGVRLSDNLASAKLMLLVEGIDDKVSIEALLGEIDPRIRKYFSSGELVVDPLGGASALSSRVGAHRANLCLVHAFLDDDEAGRKATRLALDDGLIRASEYTLTVIPSLKESEFEDYFDPKQYREVFLDNFGVDPTIHPPTAKGKKWSRAMKARFEASGKMWDDREKARAKGVIARHAAKTGIPILKKERIPSLEALAASIVREM